MGSKLTLGTRALEPLGAALVESTHDGSSPERLDADQLGLLWRLFQGIAEVWQIRDEIGPTEQLYSQWVEFIETRCNPGVPEQDPSYLEEYRSAASVLRELYGEHGTHTVHEYLYLEAVPVPAEPSNRFEHLQRYVVWEFLPVFLVAGGFRAFGAANVRGHVGGSRFRRERPYQQHEEVE